MMKTHCTVLQPAYNKLGGLVLEQKPLCCRGVQRQQKDVLAARIVSFEPINFHLDKEAPCSVAPWQN